MAGIALCLSCNESVPASPDPVSCTTFELLPSLATDQSEGYSCFAFDADVRTGPISSLRFELPSDSGVLLHHATLYTTAEARPHGAPFDCEPMPIDALAVHVAVPGSERLSLPDDTTLALRADTRTFLVEAHMFRQSSRDAGMASVTLCRLGGAPGKLAGRFALGAPVPAIRPHTLETSTARCRLPFDLHLLASWPHMHRRGHSFHAALLREDERIPILDVPAWDFNRQLTYETDIAALAGDVIESTCVWQNDSDAYVLPGIFSANEMCTHGVTGYPADAAYCEPE